MVGQQSRYLTKSNCLGEYRGNFEIYVELHNLLQSYLRESVCLTCARKALSTANFSGDHPVATDHPTVLKHMNQFLFLLCENMLQKSCVVDHVCSIYPEAITLTNTTCTHIPSHTPPHPLAYVHSYTPVADVELGNGRVAIVHVPAFDIGQACKAGVDMLLRPARDSKGILIGSTAVGKHGTPKCEFIAQLARISEPENRHISPLGVWVGAHPSLGEKLTHEMLKRGLVKELGEVVDIKREVANLCGTDMRVDFVVTHKDGTRTALEVKTPDTTDYNPTIIRVKGGKAKIQYWGHELPYRRSAIFPPLGPGKQRGPEGERVVSARSIKHVDELSAIQTGEKLCPDDERLKAAILFLVVRNDASSFRPNKEACPSFAKHLRKANERGLKVLAYRVAWGTGDEEGVAFFDGAIKVDL